MSVLASGRLGDLRSVSLIVDPIVLREGEQGEGSGCDTGAHGFGKEERQKRGVSCSTSHIQPQQFVLPVSILAVVEESDSIIGLGEVGEPWGGCGLGVRKE